MGCAIGGAGGVDCFPSDGGGPADERGHVLDVGAQERIRCNAIAPSAIMTERAYEYLERQGDDFSEKFLASPRSFRVGQPEDIAGAVAFLLSDDAEWINGQVWSVNGGAALRD